MANISGLIGLGLVIASLSALLAPQELACAGPVVNL